jgi:hypothetical protein
MPAEKGIVEKNVRSRSGHGLMPSTPIVPPLASSYRLTFPEMSRPLRRLSLPTALRAVPVHPKPDGKRMEGRSQPVPMRMSRGFSSPSSKRPLGVGFVAIGIPVDMFQFNTDRTADHRDRAWREARASEPQAVARSTGLEGLSHLRGACSDGVAR